MPYIAPYARIKSAIEIRESSGTQFVVVDYADFIDIIRGLVMAIEVDEAWYLSKYPEVARVIASGGFFKSAAHHFFVSGYLGGSQARPDPQHLASFSEIQKRLTVVPVRTGLNVEMELAAFLDVIRVLLRAVNVDDAWYSRQYLSQAQDATTDCKAHFVQSGYFAGNWPFDMRVDADWYLAAYPHAREAENLLRFKSAREHFVACGYSEGLRPNPEVLIG